MACSAMCRVRVLAGHCSLGADSLWSKQSLQAIQLSRVDIWQGAMALSTAAIARRAAGRLQGAGRHGEWCMAVCSACRLLVAQAQLGDTVKCQVKPGAGRGWTMIDNTGTHAHRNVACKVQGACTADAVCLKCTGCPAPQQWEVGGLGGGGGGGVPSLGRSLYLAAPLTCRQRLPGSWRPQCAGASPQNSAAGAVGGAPGPPPPSPAGS